MKHLDYTKLWDANLHFREHVQAKGKSGAYHNARPVLYGGIWFRIRDAWNVLVGKADALYWTIDQD